MLDLPFSVRHPRSKMCLSPSLRRFPDSLLQRPICDTCRAQLSYASIGKVHESPSARISPPRYDSAVRAGGIAASGRNCSDRPADSYPVGQPLSRLPSLPCPGNRRAGRLPPFCRRTDYPRSGRIGPVYRTGSERQRFPAPGPARRAGPTARDARGTCDKEVAVALSLAHSLQAVAWRRDAVSHRGDPVV
jgi:hypothetical protein